jgi:hypothetical protein
MSDGMYTFNEIREQNNFTGTVQVSQGKFRGENDFYQYHGAFSIKNSILEGSIIIKNKKTEKMEHIPFSTSINNEEFKIVIDTNNMKINLLCHKQQQKPFLS